MLVKSDSESIQSYFADASNLAGGQATRVLIPQSSEEIADELRRASREGTHVTVAGAGTGVVGGRVPFGGIVISTEKLAQIGDINHEGHGGYAVAGAGVVLSDFQREVSAKNLLYPPDPTETNCFLGGTVATNASGARTFKYGPTRAYVRRLKIALACGDSLDIRRGEILADAEGRLRVPLGEGRSIEARLPTYRMPATRKHAAGYFVEPGLDLIDLFIGSEGTLGVITEVEVALLPQPEGVLSGVVFFKDEGDLLEFVREARELSLRTREESGAVRALQPSQNAKGGEGKLDARALEFFDNESLKFMRERYPLVPLRAAGAVFFEQETSSETEEGLMTKWLVLVEKHCALAEDSWFGTNTHDRAEMRAFRHALPVMVNEWLARHGQRKVSTDMAVPDEAFPQMLQFYKDTLRESSLQYVIFGHIGDNHVHVNILPRDDVEAFAARELYKRFINRAVSMSGTISAEHGVGKTKREYMRVLYGDKHLFEMAALKRAFDPECILGRGNIFAEKFL